MDRPCAPCSCQVLHSGTSPPHLAVFSFHVSRFPSVGMFDAGPALCQQAALGAGQCSSTPPPAHLFPPATTISISLIRTGCAQPCHPWSLPCAHAHTCSLCFRQTTPRTHPCPGAAQNDFSSDKHHPLQAITQPRPPWTRTSMSPQASPTALPPDPGLLMLCGKERGGLCTGWGAQMTPSISKTTFSH